MERGDEIEMFFAGFIVAEKLSLEDVFEEFFRDGTAARVRRSFYRCGTSRGEFERVVGGAGVAICEGGDAEQDVVRYGDGVFAETVLLVGERATKEFDDLRRGERIEDVDLGAREERGDHFKGRVLSSGTDENNVARFDVREKGVLLGFIEAVNFVHKNDGAMAGAGFLFGDGHDFFNFFDAGEDGTEGNEFGAGEAGDDACERSFTATGWPPEKHGAEIV